MLTPQNIQEKEFDRAKFGGYDMAEVDEFLEEITEDYSSLLKENATLKAKMKVLVEKIEEYRSTEDAMRMALLTAQKTGNTLVREANEKCRTMLTEADAKASAMIADAEAKSSAMIADAEVQCRTMLANTDAETKGKIAEYVELTKFENDRLEKAITNSMQYINLSRKMAEKQLQFLDKLSSIKAEPVEIPEYDFLRQPEPAAEPAPVEVPVQEAVPEVPAAEPAVPEQPAVEDVKEDAVIDAARQIDESIASMYGTTDTQSAEQAKTYRRKTSDIDWDDDDEPTSPRPKFDFSNLQFGKNFDIGNK